MSPGMVPGRSSIGNGGGGSVDEARIGQVFRTSAGTPAGAIGPQNANTEAVSGRRPPAGAPEQVFGPLEPEAAGGFLTADGQHDSHAVELAAGGRNGSPRAGRPYRRITWAQIRQLVEHPAARTKDTAQLVILSTYAEHDGRTHAVQRERGWFGGLAVDIDKGNASREQVAAAVRDALGNVAAEIYSSSSAEPGERKWRVLLPLRSGIPGADYADTQAALFALLEQRGLDCDPTLTRAAQPVFLPNVPPKRRGPGGRPRFYEWEHLAGELLELVPGSAIVAERDALRARRAADEAEQAARALVYAERRRQRVAATGDDFDPVQSFNDSHTVAEVLKRCGFERKPTGKGSHWKSPLSTSGSYSTEDRGGHWVTVSAWAKTHDIGRESRTGNRYGDAFDLFAGIIHKGHRAAAIEAYVDVARPGWLDGYAAAHHDGDRRAALAELAEVARYGRRTLTTSQPEVPVRIEQYETSRDPVPLDEWRRELEAGVALEAERPGLKLLRGAPGCGKTYAVARAMAGRSGGLEAKPAGVVSAPGHEFCGELVDELRSMGLDAAAYPKLDEHTCRHWDEASYAQAAGLPVTACVCSSCPFKRECREDGYLALVKLAEQAPHKVCTHERLARSAVRLTKDAAYVTVEEDPSKLLRPSVSTTARQLERFASLADELAEASERYRILEGLPPAAPAVERFDAFDAWSPAGAADDDEPEQAGPVTFNVRPSFFHRLAALAGELAKRCREAINGSTPAGVHELEVPVLDDLPRNPEGAIWHALEQLRRGSKGGAPLVPREALTLTLYAATGRLERLYLQIDEDKRPGRPPARIVHAVGFWKTDLPWDRVPVWVNDGTLDAEALEQLAGVPVVDVTPGGELELVQHAEQYPVDILPSTSTAKVGRILAGIVRAHPERERVGVVMLKRHREELLFPADGVPRLPADVLERISFSTHYGSGDDRGSNEFHRACDLVLVLGTFRPPPAEVRRALVRRGQLEAANATGTWGTVERRAVGPAGELVTFGGRGYAEGQWAAAADGLTRAAVRQAIGRARAICADGVPVVLVSTENGGLPVRPAGELPVLDDRADRVLEAVARISETVSENAPAEGSRDPSGPGSNCAQKPYKTLIGKMGAVGTPSGEPPGVTLEQLVEALPGVPYPTLRKWVARAVEAGELVREGSTTATRYRLPAAHGPALAVVEHQALPSPPIVAETAGEPPWLKAELEPARHPATLAEVRWLVEYWRESLQAGEPAWEREITPPLVLNLHRAAVVAAEARGQPPPSVELVARHTASWHAVTCGAA
jgi:hypothetical protein